MKRSTISRLMATLALLVTTGMYAHSYAASPVESNPRPPRIKIKAEAPLQLPPDLYFGEVSSVAVNSKNHVFVFSRGNSTGPAYGAAAAQVPGAPDAMCITPGPNQVLFVADVNPSRVYKVSLEGKVLGMIGDPGGKLGEFRAIHGLACVDDHTIWVADMFNWRAQKITME